MPVSDLGCVITDATFGTIPTTATSTNTAATTVGTGHVCTIQQVTTTVNVTDPLVQVWQIYNPNGPDHKIVESSEYWANPGLITTE